MTVKTSDNFDRFYTEQTDGNYQLEATLVKNDIGLVRFPDTGNGFGRYGDKGSGGLDNGELRGADDHYLKPLAAAGLFGMINILREEGVNQVDFGDMSSSNGSDPGTKSSIHHGGHGHKGKRVGLDIDFRYLNNSGYSFQEKNAFGDKNFSGNYNQTLYDTAENFGFTRNYQGLSGTLDDIQKVKGHNNHGHLGFNSKSVRHSFISSAPQSQPGFFQGIINWAKSFFVTTQVVI